MISKKIKIKKIKFFLLGKLANEKPDLSKKPKILLGQVWGRVRVGVEVGVAAGVVREKFPERVLGAISNCTKLVGGWGII